METFKLVEGLAYFTGRNIQTEPHAHHALELIFGIEEPFDLSCGSQLLKSTYGAVIAPNCTHQFTGKNASYLFIFLEPELMQSSQIRDHYGLGDPAIRSLDRLSAFPDPDRVIDFSFFIETLRIPLTLTKYIRHDERVSQSLALIKNTLHLGPLKTSTLATNACLSTSRFSHLFKEQIGIPVRKYILWCRIQHAMMQLLKGRNFTESAHAAGFSDSAHFSRTFSAMFGVAPSSALKG